MKQKIQRIRWSLLVPTLLWVALGGLVSTQVIAANPLDSISQIPLTVAIPQHPQVIFAVANSESMDGNLSGAIMTGSGSLGASQSLLNNTSSPVNFTIPSGFTPPVNAGSGGIAPYTVSQSGTLIDNSPSRLNVAKQGIQSILNSYMANTDFALLDYSLSNIQSYKTWVYHLSPPGGFSFSATNTNPPPGNRYILNPCFGYKGASSSSSEVYQDCTQLAAQLYNPSMSTSQYMLISATSDDPNINDVLYSGSQDAVGVSYLNPTPSSPYTYYSLSQYNNGSVSVTYQKSVPSNTARTTSPTNAGFIPFTPQTMYVERGFAYGASQSATTGNVEVPLVSAGLQPTQATVNASIAKFASSLAPETNKANTAEIKAAAGQSTIAGLLSKSNSYAKSVVDQNNGCAAKQYVVLLTDGLPTQDLKGKNWPPLGSAAAAGYGEYVTFNSDGTVSSTNDQALLDTLKNLTDLSSSGIKTYIVGLGAGVDPSLNPVAAQTLRAMAIAGGTDTYIPATTPETLVDGLNNILVKVQAGSVASSSAAVNSTGLNSNSHAYQASYTVSTQPYQDWTGDLQSYQIASDGTVDTSTPSWSAQALLDQKTQGSGWDSKRLVATWNLVTATGVPFRWNDINATQKGSLDSTDSLGQQRLNYLRGDTSQEKRSGGKFRNRSHILGDLVHSAPLYVSAPAGSIESLTYQDFVVKNQDRTPMIYFGGNDGLLHAFNANTGVEKFAFVPNAMMPNLPALSDPLYNTSHRFYVDGSPQAGDVQFVDDSWHTILASSEGAGGNSVFALDITDPDSITNETILASKVLWEFTDVDLNLGFSSPAITKVNSAPGYAVFFGNGYQSSSNTDVLYALNSQTGELIRKMNLCTMVPTACSSTQSQGLSSVVAANSQGSLGAPADHLYVGDLQGNLWSVDISNSDASKWTALVLFKAGKPITVTPAVTLNPNFPSLGSLMVFFGTGRLLNTNDLSSTDIQSFYGVIDDSPTTPYTQSNLLEQTLTTLTAAQSGQDSDTRISTNLFPSPPQKGWFFNLPNSGERVISDPRIDNGGVVFTTYTPATSACSVGGTSFLMDVNFINGGPFSQPEFDANGDGLIDARDSVKDSKGTLQNPVGISLGNYYIPAPTIISANLGNAKRVKLLTRSDKTIKSINERGGGIQKVGWWQDY